MKKLKKYISVLAAVFMLASYTSFAVYAAPDTVESEDAEEEDPDELIPIEEDESTDPDDEDIDFVDDAPAPATDPAPEVDVVPESDPFIEPEDTTAAAEFETPAYNPVDSYTMYSSEVVNVRYGPDTSYSKLGTVYAGSPVTVVGYSGGWLAIKYNGTTGFVSASFFSETAPETTTAAETTAQTTVPDDTTETQEGGFAEIIESETTAATEAPEETTEKTKKTKPAETTEATEDTDKAAASTETEKNGGGMNGLLLAIGCAVGTFLVVGVIPVIIHSIYHKKLYQY